MDTVIGFLIGLIFGRFLIKRLRDLCLALWLKHKGKEP